MSTEPLNQGRDTGHLVSEPRAISETAPGPAHAHLCAVLTSELGRFTGTGPVCILDAGCGDGRLLLHLHKVLSASRLRGSFQLCGLDVGDHGVQSPGFLTEAVARLAAGAPSVD